MSEASEAKKPVGRPRKEAKLAKFAFIVIELSKDMDGFDRATELNKIGEVGGELVAVVPKHDGTHVCYFMAEFMAKIK